jgi:arylsulfatase A-like enzyme/Tfp pilus assembly protein PilF
VQHGYRGSTIGRALCCACLPLVALACADGSRTAAVRREPGLSVLLITIDTLRADALGAYGNTKVATPGLDRLASGGVRFSRASAHNVVTLPSHVNILTGQYPFHHGVRENSGFRVPAEVETLATVLKARGYRTGAFVSAFPLDVRFGLARGFDVYDDRYGKGAERPAFREPERAGPATVAAAVEWIGRQQEPWFAWVHLYEPHFPYAPPEPLATTYRNEPYLGEVSAADAALLPLVSPILNQGAASRTMVIVTGDHGEALGDHGESTHGIFAYEATLRIPLIVYQPRLFGARVVDEAVRHVDIFPTVLDAVGIDPPKGIDGRSLLAMASGQKSAPASTYFESLSASLNRGWAPLVGAIDGSLKYIDLPIPELYDLASDPSESHNLAAARTADLQRMQALLKQFGAGDAKPVRVAESADARARLRSLGYVSGTAAPKATYTEADDPKRLIALDRQTDELMSRYLQGDVRGAIAMAESVTKQRPDMAVTWTHLAFLYNQAGDHASAVRAIRRALDLNPGSPDVASLFAAYLTDAGLAKEALPRLEPYVRIPQPDFDVLNAYGVALASVNRADEALSVFEQARTLDPGSGLPLTNIGTVYLMRGDAARASSAFTSAVALDPTLARAQNGLGVIAAQRGAFDEAATHWRKAIALDPHDYQVLYNLGDVLVKLRRPAEARQYWERYLQEAPPASDEMDRARVRSWLIGSGTNPRKDH